MCDTAKQPDTIGIRASMPGHAEGRAALDALPRAVQGDEDTWADVEDADSGWRALGIAKGVPVESGWSFSFAKPPRP